ncbi:MAG: ribosomal protein S5 [Candidatus Paceibacterota bacterium]
MTDVKTKNTKPDEQKVSNGNSDQKVSNNNEPAKEGGHHKEKRSFKREVRKPRMEYEQKIISIRRVTRVVAGGRRFSFSVSLVVGDKKGSVGVGMGKASDTALAIEKAYNDAKNAMIKPVLKEDMSIPHTSEAKFTSSEVFVKPAPGKGLIAGGSVRTVLELAGITDVNAKIFSRSKNAFNNARATVVALSKLTPETTSVKKK